MKKIMEDLNKDEEEIDEEEEQYANDEYNRMHVHQETFVKAIEIFGIKSIDTPIFGG